MRVVLSIVIVITALACGSQESGEPESPAQVGAYPLESAEMGVDQVSACLDEKQKGNFATALTICEEAIAIDPDNTELGEALEWAREQNAETPTTPDP